MNKRSLVFFLITAVITAVIADYSFAQSSSYALPADKSSTWKAGVTKLLGKNLSPEYAYLSFSIPQIVLKTVSQCKRHLFSEEESVSYRKHLIEERAFSVKKEIDTLITTLDNTFFDPEQNKEEIKRLQKRIEQKKEELSFIESLHFDDLVVEEEKDIEIITSEEEGGLLPYPVVSPQTAGERLSLQLIIYGIVEEIEGYLFLEVKAWNTNLGEVVFNYQDGFSKEEAGKRAELAGEKLLKVVLGHEWSKLSIITEPDNGDIYIDDQFYARGNIRNVLLSPGEYNLSVQAPGYKDVEKTIFLEAEQKKTVEVILDSDFAERITIKSIPAGASVYLNSAWVGSTPASVLKPEQTQELIIKKEGYRDAVLYLPPDCEDFLTISLSPDVFEWEEYIEKKRDAFYLSFGFFALSVPIPVLLYSLSEDLATGFNIAFAQRNLEEMERIYKDASVAYNTYIGGLFLSGALLVNTFIHLFDYLAAGTR